jgi:hypothetical protein
MTLLFSSRLPFVAPVASILLLVAACGGGGAAGTGGASPGTTTATGTGGAIPQARVILRDHAGRPAKGIDVLVHDPDGTTTQQTKTDKTGAANVDLVKGGGVTALWIAAQDLGAPEYTAVSVVGLEPGAEVRLLADAVDTAAPPASSSFSFTGVPPLQSTAWDIVLSCFQESTTGEQVLSYSGCPGSSSYDLVAFLAPGDQRLTFPAQALMPGQMVHFSLDPAKAEAAPTIGVAIKAIPAATTRLEALLSANRPEGGRTRHLTSSDVTTPQDTTLQMGRLIVSAGGSFDVDLGALGANGGVHTRLYFAENTLPTSPIPWSVPTVTAVAKIGTVGGSTRRPEVPWSLDVAGAPADAVRLQLAYQASDPAPAMGTKHASRWTIHLISTTAGLAVFPEIPASFAGFAPESTSFTVLADQIDVPTKDSLIAAVNADFDRVDVSFASSSFTVP